MKLSDVECPKGLLILLMKVKYFINFGHIMQCINKKIYLLVKINSEFRISENSGILGHSEFRLTIPKKNFQVPNSDSENKNPFRPIPEGAWRRRNYKLSNFFAFVGFNGMITCGLL